MKNTLIGWLASKNIILANDASDHSVLEAVQKAFVDRPTVTIGNDKVVTLENELTTAKGRIATLENEKVMLDAKVATLGNEKKAERTARSGAVVDLAITKGKLNVHERETKITALSNEADFEKAEKALLGSAYKVKTVAGGTGSAGDNKIIANDGTTGDARDQYCTAFKEECEKNGGDPVQAHKAAMKKYPMLADALKTREAGAMAAK